MFGEAVTKGEGPLEDTERSKQSGFSLAEL